MATSNFPSSLDTTSALPASISETANLNSPNHADMHEVTNDAIIEIEEKLGTGDTTASTGAVLIGTGSGASAWDTSPTFLGDVTVGVNDTGHDVKFFGATDGSYMLWDESANSLHVSQQVTSSTLTDFTQALDKASIKLIGDYTEDHYQGAILWSTDDDNATKPKAGIWVKTTSGGSQLEFGTSGTYGTGITNTALSIGTDGTVTVAGELDAASLDVSGNADIDGIAYLDVVSVDGTLTVGVDDTGYDVTFHGDTATMKAHWDTSQNALAITSANAALRLVDTDANSAPYVGFYDSSYNSDVSTGRLGYVGYPNNDDLYIRNDDADGHVYIVSQNAVSIAGTIVGTNSIPRMAYRPSGGAAVLPTNQMNAIPTIFINPAANAPSATSAGDIWFGV